VLGDAFLHPGQETRKELVKGGGGLFQALLFRFHGGSPWLSIFSGAYAFPSVLQTVIVAISFHVQCKNRADASH
jgi:hypothetical protein